jgi:isochorismate hydrolase
VPEVPAETLEVLALLADLQRYGTMSADDVRRELTAATQALARQRNDANRVRLAVLYTLAKTTPQDDQRALQLLDNVAKSNAGPPAVKQVAAVLQAQINERLRAVRDEQVKADVAIQKLEALRAMERSLLRDRVRSGGGGGGAGGGGSSGSGSGGGGGGAGGGGR